MLKESGRKIRTAGAPDVAVIGCRYLARMAIVRLSERGLFVWQSSSWRAARGGLKRRQTINFQ